MNNGPVLAALAMAFACAAHAQEDMGVVAITQSWPGVAPQTVETRPEQPIGRGWAIPRGPGGRASITALWPVTVGDAVRYLETSLLYEVMPDGSVRRAGIIGRWDGLFGGFHCPDWMAYKACYVADPEAGEVRFKNATVRGNPEARIPDLRLDGVWKVRLHLDREATKFKQPAATPKRGN